MSTVGFILALIVVIIVGVKVYKTVMGFISLAACCGSFAYLGYVTVSLAVVYLGLDIPTIALFSPIIGASIGIGVYEGIQAIPLSILRGLCILAISAVAIFVYVYQTYPHLITQFIK